MLQAAVAVDKRDATRLVLLELSPRGLGAMVKEAHKVSPLAGAAFSSNWVLFRKVYNLVEDLSMAQWSRTKVGLQPQ